ncbi:EAL domain-containing protein [Cytobacillus praedii]|uniref:bifunctional diguanylate cyclase/phosphodiesterase n=1 Tax=Cytobacillus praedii TaxID=1742358 RepID=UPI002E1B6225|nr:EAL domain-containing protein [Cytobacillus praedii]
MFSPPPINNGIEVSGEYSLPIVILSIIIASLASFTAISMNERIQKNSFFHRNFWLVLASLAMGFGIWSMHFVGMSALSLPFMMHYDSLLTCLSIIPSVIASFLAFYIVNQKKRSITTYLLSGIFMGIGISTMHYTGMASMVMDAYYVYNPWIFITSIITAILVSFVALYIFSRQQRYAKNNYIKALTSAIMGLAVPSMHYIGMAGTSFYLPKQQVMTAGHHMNMTLLITGVTIGITLLLGLLQLSSLVDRYVDFRVSHIDILTKLPNRRSFEKALNDEDVYRSIAVWNLHNLEKVNNDHGYHFGDEVIQYAANALHQLNIPLSELYRIDGNRLALLLQGKDRLNELQHAMKNISAKWNHPVIIQEKKILLQGVCAISTINDQQSQKRLFSDILAVLSSPGIQYKNEVIRFDPHIHTYSFEQEILNTIDQAMKNDDLFLVYQPKVNAGTHKIVGLEALIRWNHTEHGFLSPGVFIPILEQSHRISDVTNWVINKVCNQIKVWEEQNLPTYQIAINIPGEYVTSPRLLRTLKKELNRYSVNPSLVELEITETTVMESAESSMRAINTFREAGFSVALDDFGTGISSLSNLRQMPISTLKIDKSFVDEVPQSEKDSSILEAIIALGHSLNLNIVIEGVETKNQVDFLTSTSSLLSLQGYYFAKPMEPDEVMEWIKARNNE